eukprot:CAMPEP_0172509992 /NCGR_PEP_ID=MMETSP1066-20121228/225294_1 /TAXON_ID=671091 /ORGANISM="Coscinodiscus wailesii, Strain CCMP2513" /LENGTH=387 /DNA_ID=CAMNT_0013288773 /DNA_START=45 /DNA_END=1208 /DNA_ORIENTATION=+
MAFFQLTRQTLKSNTILRIGRTPSLYSRCYRTGLTPPLAVNEIGNSSLVSALRCTAGIHPFAPLRNARTVQTETAPDPEKNVITIPPNLKFDPECVSTPYYGIEEIHLPAADNDDDDNKDANETPRVDTTTTPRHFDATTRPKPPTAIPLPHRLKVPILDFSPTVTAPPVEIGTIHLSPTLFGRDPVRTDLIHRVIIYQRNKKRGKRTAKTKNISEVSGSGRKVRPQKGQGRARAGHKRPPHWRGGARAHGPRGIVQDYTTKLNKKVRRAGLCHALSQKLLEGNLFVVGTLEVGTYKTKEVGAIFDAFDVSGKYGTSCYVLDEVVQEEEEKESVAGVHAYVKVGARNLPNVKVVNQIAANVYDIIKHEKIIISLSALTALEKRLGED